MKISAIHEYSHSTADLFKVLTDFDSVRAKYEALGHSAVELVSRNESKDGAVTIVTRRIVPLELPGFAKRFLSPKQTVVQTDEWLAPDAAGRRTGTFKVEAKGTPVKISGTMLLVPDSPRKCTDTTKVTIECGLPLIGGKLADFVGGDTRRAVDHEYEWTSQHLGSSSPRRTGVKRP